MKHIGEHRLELHVLHETFPQREESEIREHLEKCPLCRKRHSLIEDFYTQVVQEWMKHSDLEFAVRPMKQQSNERKK